jgi:hypothetical protein
MKKSGNRSPPKVNNSIVKDLRDSEVDEISNNELNTMMIRVINEIKDDV